VPLIDQQILGLCFGSREAGIILVIVPNDHQVCAAKLGRQMHEIADVERRQARGLS
jgi:hypothetical protein